MCWAAAALRAQRRSPTTLLETVAARGCNKDEVINEEDLRLPEVGPGVGGAAIAHGNSATRLSLLYRSSKRWMNVARMRHSSNRADNGCDEAAAAARSEDTFSGNNDETIAGA